MSHWTPTGVGSILGDERNYVGTSFVTMDMFGSYQYGSELLNVTFDHSVGRVCILRIRRSRYEGREDILDSRRGVGKPLGAAISQSRPISRVWRIQSLFLEQTSRGSYVQ